LAAWAAMLFQSKTIAAADMVDIVKNDRLEIGLLDMMILLLLLQTTYDSQHALSDTEQSGCKFRDSDKPYQL
jgi:hypothetical protein